MYWTKTAAVVHLVTATDKVGIGTSTCPHGGIGAAKVAIEGANGHVDGPHLQFSTAADNHPVSQWLNWSHDSIYLSWDCSTVDATNWLSSDVGSNFAQAKKSDKFEFWYDSGVAQGGAITWNVGLSLDTAGLVNIPTALSIGTAVASAGDLRHANNTVCMAALNAAGTNDIPLVATDNFDNAFFGDPTHTTVGVLRGSSSAALQAAGVGTVRVYAATAETTVPLAVNVGTVASAGDIRMTATGIVAGRNAGDTLDLNYISRSGDNLIFGNVTAGSTKVYSLLQTELFGGGALRLTVTGTYVQQASSTYRFSSAVVAPKITQYLDATAGVTADDLTGEAQGASDPAGNAFAGDFGITGGKGTVHAGNKDGNAWFHTAPAAWNLMEMGIFVGDCVTAPNANPANGGYLYSNAGAGTWRGSGGTITAFGPAGPRCSACGHDHWVHVSVNERFGSYYAKCRCGKEYKGGPDNVLAQLEPHELDELVYEDGDPNDKRPPHKKRSLIETVAGPAHRRKDVKPTIQGYRRQWREAICDAAVVDETEVEYDTGKVDDEGSPIMATQTLRTVDQDASRAQATQRLAALRASLVGAWQSWRDLYSDGRDDEAELIADLDADIADSDADADELLAEHEWELPPVPPDDV